MAYYKSGLDIAEGCARPGCILVRLPFHESANGERVCSLGIGQWMEEFQLRGDCSNSWISQWDLVNFYGPAALKRITWGDGGHHGNILDCTDGPMKGCLLTGSTKVYVNLNGYTVGVKMLVTNDDIKPILGNNFLGASCNRHKFRYMCLTLRKA